MHGTIVPLRICSAVLTHLKEGEMLDAERCRRYARQFLTRSRQLKDPHTKAAMIEIAVCWTQLAAQVENRRCVPQQQQYTRETSCPSLAPE
jgi:hypothetical protein